MIIILFSACSAMGSKEFCKKKKILLKDLQTKSNPKKKNGLEKANLSVAMSAPRNTID